jgi:hypothetical protein
MDCFSEDQLPVMTMLAKEFAICDNWFSSMPGPTWPNRFFLVAGTSGGLYKSPNAFEIATSTLLEGYEFEHGNIFDAMDRHNIPWTIFSGDRFPMSKALKGMNRRERPNWRMKMSEFESRVKDQAFASKFIFIEPKYGKHKFDLFGPGDFDEGNSMHPLADATASDALVKHVYKTIRNSTLWEKSVLLIVFDEHGGFYDHVPPPEAVPPGDKPIHAHGDPQLQFKFDQYGVRVPAIVISPLIKKGTIDHTPFDHCSALSTIEKSFGMDPLTERDKHAKDFRHLFSLPKPRTDAPVEFREFAYPEFPMDDFDEESPDELRRELEVIEDARTSAFLTGDGIEEEATPAQIGFAYIALLQILDGDENAEENEEASLSGDVWKAEFAKIRSRYDAARFMTEAKLKVYYDEDTHGLAVS